MVTCTKRIGDGHQKKAKEESSQGRCARTTPSFYWDQVGNHEQIFTVSNKVQGRPSTISWENRREFLSKNNPDFHCWLPKKTPSREKIEKNNHVPGVQRRVIWRSRGEPWKPSVPKWTWPVQNTPISVKTNAKETMEKVRPETLNDLPFKGTGGPKELVPIWEADQESSRNLEWSWCLQLCLWNGQFHPLKMRHAKHKQEKRGSVGGHNTRKGMEKETPQILGSRKGITYWLNVSAHSTKKTPVTPETRWTGGLAACSYVGIGLWKCIPRSTR